MAEQVSRLLPQSGVNRHMRGSSSVVLWQIDVIATTGPPLMVSVALEHFELADKAICIYNGLHLMAQAPFLTDLSLGLLR